MKRFNPVRFIRPDLSDFYRQNIQAELDRLVSAGLVERIIGPGGHDEYRPTALATITRPQDPGKDDNQCSTS